MIIQRILLLLLFILVTTGCTRHFRDEPVTPEKITVNSAKASFNSIFLAWNYPDGLPTSNIGGYELYRSSSNVVAVTTANLIATLPPDQNTYEDTSNITENSTYYYRILYKDFYLNPVDVSDPKEVTTSSREDVALVVARSAPASPTLSVTVTNYYPKVNFRLVRGNGILALVPTSAIPIITGIISDGSTINYRDVEALPGQTYTYQAFGAMATEGDLTGNAFVITY